MDFEFLTSNTWRLRVFGITAAIGFAFIINRIRKGADAQLPQRQAAGWVLICGSLVIAIGLLVDTFRRFGLGGGGVAIVAAAILARILMALAGRD